MVGWKSSSFRFPIEDAPLPALLANARMYAASPAAEAAWRALLEEIGALAEVELTYAPHPPPALIDTLWRRRDLGAAFMCGYPLALGLFPVTPLAAPIPTADWAEGRPVYRTDFVVRGDSRFSTLADTFGGTIGWTTEHSHSGFNAVRYHLLAYREPGRRQLYAETVGPLMTPRSVVEAVMTGRVDVGPVDSYALTLMQRHGPDEVAGLRIVESTALAPIPALVASDGIADDVAARLRAAFTLAEEQPWFSPLAGRLALAGFSPVDRDDYAVTIAWQEAALAEGYARPG